MNKSNYKKYLSELLVVAFGVFLGVFASEWSSQKKINNNVSKTLEYIVSEIDLNIEKFDKAIKYHIQINKEVDSLWSTLNNEDKLKFQYQSKKFLYNKLPTWNSIGTVNPDNIVYESAKISGVFQELDISTTRLIANAYKLMNQYSNTSSTTLNKMIAINSSSKVSDVYSIFYLLKYDILPIEVNILNNLKETKIELEKIIHKKVYN